MHDIAGIGSAPHIQALDIGREIGNRRGEGSRLGGLGITYYSLGQYDKARGYCKQSLLILEEIKSPYADQVRKLLFNLRAIANSMDKYYLDKIDSVCRSMVNEIKSSGIKIKVEIKNPVVIEVPKLSSYADEFGGIIYTPCRTYFPSPAVYHELLHIRRFCIDKVPQLKINGNEEERRLFTTIDNDIEHFVILHDEFKKYKERIPRWKKKYTALLDECKKESHPDAQKVCTILTWMHVKHLFPGSDLTKKADKLIENLKLRSNAVDIMSQCLQSIDSKKDLVIIILSILKEPLGISPDRVYLKYLDCKNSTSCRKSLDIQ